MTVLIVDGYNAIYAVPGTRQELRQSLLKARRSILASSREYARTSGYIDEVMVVFDGNDKYRYMDEADISRDRTQIFSRTGSGDDKIIETIKLYARKGKVVVASNDNYVRNNARAYGAALIDVRDLAAAETNKQKRVAMDGSKCMDSDMRDEITREYREELGL